MLGGMRHCLEADAHMSYPMPISARLDMGQPLQPHAPRLQLSFGEPLRIVQAHTAEELPAALQQVQLAAADGLWCIGGLQYEAAAALDARLPTHPVQGPLAWFALYAAPLAPAESIPSAPVPSLDWAQPLSQAEFSAGMQTIQADIAAGRYYQVNYTQALQARAESAVDGPALFAALQQAQPGGYALWLDMGAQQVLSVSPELFFDWHQPAQGSGAIVCRPMKGTARRGPTAAEDTALAKALKSSPKERAENVMIVDLLRNDLGRIAEVGSVQVPKLFQVEALPSVWQMSSEVRARLPAGSDLLRLFGALFPCGSITGAPKRMAMQAIHELEPEPRGWYCGALGVVRSDGAGGVRATFNVPIRTLVLADQQLRCGIGSGITAQSSVAGEWREWRYKQGFVQRVSAPFALLETLALDEGQLCHAGRHLQRMAQAAAHFGYPWEPKKAEQALLEQVHAHPLGRWRLRLELAASGRLQAQTWPCASQSGPVNLQLADRPLEAAHSEFVRFKTSRRAHYEAFAPQEAAVFDRILWNEDEELTECTRGNLAVLLDGQWLTPALSCGLLAGVGRGLALEQGRVSEGRIRLADVPRVEAWAFVNSLRGWIPARLVA